MKQLSCNQCREHWDDFINKSTFEADPQFADVRAHLEDCADCRKMFDLQVAARQELQQFPTQKAPASLRASIRDQIETSRQPKLTWWNSFHLSPQRLAWASGAIVTVFVVALLMRPERQTRVMQTPPEVLSNRAQVEEQNASKPPQAAVAPLESESDKPAEKVLSQQSETPTQTSKPPLKRSQKAGATKKPPAKSAPPVVTSPTDTGTEAPAPGMDKQSPIPRVTPKPANPQLQGEVKPAPAPLASANNDELGTAAAAMGKTSGPPSVSRQSEKPVQESLRDGSMQRYRSQSSAVIHWTHIITSDYEADSAKIRVTLPEGLDFADNNAGTKERVLWQGKLSRGQKIPLAVDVLAASEETAKLHLVMIDAETQKVLLDRHFDIR